MTEVDRVGTVGKMRKLQCTRVCKVTEKILIYLPDGREHNVHLIKDALKAK